MEEEGVAPAANAAPCSPPTIAIVSSSLPTTPAPTSPQSSLRLSSPTPTSPSPKRRKLTKEEKETERLQREEKKRQLELERLEKQRVRDEDKKRRDEEKKRKDEEKKRKDEEKEHERLKREEEKKRRDEEKKRRDEEKEHERIKREEEKRKREKDKLKKDEERIRLESDKKQEFERKEAKKRKQAEFMERFLGKKSSTESNPASPELSVDKQESSSTQSVTKTTVIELIDLENEDKMATPKNLINKFNTSFNETAKPFKLMPFQVKHDMALAPKFRRSVLTSEEKKLLDVVLGLDDEMEVDSDKENMDKVEIKSTIKDMSYLKELKIKQIGRQGRTKVNSCRLIDNDVEVVIDDVERVDGVAEFGKLLGLHYKLLQFCDNRRPAYWGTWKTKAMKVKGRRPFFKEEAIDYEVDSDDEWEDEPEDGEDLKSENLSIDEEEPLRNDDDDEDEDEDDGWMVPHGYLSDDERADKVIDGDGDCEGSSKKFDDLKKLEEQYYSELKHEKKLGLPYIQTDNLTEYRTILYTKKKERYLAKRDSSRPFYEKVKQGTLQQDEVYSSSDEEDMDWTDVSSGSTLSSDDDEEFLPDNDEELEIEKQGGIDVVQVVQAQQH